MPRSPVSDDLPIVPLRVESTSARRRPFPAERADGLALLDQRRGVMSESWIEVAIGQWRKDGLSCGVVASIEPREDGVLLQGFEVVELETWRVLGTTTELRMALALAERVDPGKAPS